MPIKVAVAGLGNCASSLIQGIEYYKKNGSLPGVIEQGVCGYFPSDIEFVLGIDIDQRKVGLDIADAIFAAPNNTTMFHPDVEKTGCKVVRGPALDGVAMHMLEAGDRGFILSEAPELSQDQIVSALRQSGADILVNFLPVGSEEASAFYADCAIKAGLGFVNCIPVFIASNPQWEQRFRQAGLPIVGDDIKAQIGATILHRRLSQLFAMRNVDVQHTYQLNTGGNTDFMNMLDTQRLGHKKHSKTQAVQDSLRRKLDNRDITIGPAEYVPWQKDRKVAFLRIEGAGWGGVPMELEVRLAVEDSPNAAACVLDAIRYCKAALDAGQSGVLKEASAFYCKHPPVQLEEQEAYEALQAFHMELRDAAE